MIDYLTLNSSASKMKFSWNNSSQKPRLVIITEDEDNEFDPTTLQHWREEGFAVSYIPLPASQNLLVKQLHDFADGLELGEKYAVVGQVATVSNWLNLKPAALSCEDRRR